MNLTFRFKIAPTKRQYAHLAQLCEQQRRLYNAALQERIDGWKRSGLTITKLDQFKSLTEIRSFDHEYASVPVAVSRWSISRVDHAFKGFFGRLKKGGKAGFPRFKSRSRWRSFGFDEWRGIRLREQKLVSQAFPDGLKVRLHRPIPERASIKSCTFTKVGQHWFICMAVDVPAEAIHPAPDTAVGIDVGVEFLLTTSAGQHVENIRPRQRQERSIRVAQRALARCNKGSRRRALVKERMARVQRKVADTRSTYLHQVAARLANEYAFIAVEDLRVKNMTRSSIGIRSRQKAGLNLSMLDAAVARLIEFLSYKAERAGGILVKIDPRYTSQDCSSCGVRVPKSLSTRTHSCSECGTVLQRDHNASINILNRAIEAHGRARLPGDANVGQQPMRCLKITEAEAA